MAQTMPGILKAQTPYQEKIVFESMQEFSQDVAWRATSAAMWEEIAELIDPPSRNTFFFGDYNTPGVKKTDKQIDATGMMALQRFCAIMDSLLTPRNMEWHALEADNAKLNKSRNVKLWFEQATRQLFRYRYAPMANFASQNFSNYRSIGAYGTGGMFTDRFDGMSGERGIRYKHFHLGELYIGENHQGLVYRFNRIFRLNAAQAKLKWPDTFPEILRPALDNRSQSTYMFLHRVCPREDYDPQRLDEKGKPWASYYISLDGKCLLEEGGYHTFPLAASRYDQTPGEVYGRGWATYVLPALKTLNAEKRTFLKQGHRAADPVLLTADDGIVDLSLRPGAINPGGVNTDGKPMVHVLPTGKIQISKEMMAEEKQLINDSALVTLFQIMTESPQMTATEVIERINEKAILLAPTVGRQQSEYLGPLIDRELDLLMQLQLLDPMPQELIEARGSYKVIYTSPLSRMMQAGDAAGFWRAVDQAKDAYAISQDQSLFDPFDFKTAIPGTAAIYGTKESWMSDPRAIKAKEDKREKAIAKQQQINAAPGQAALMGAQAKQAQAGIGPQANPSQQQPGP